MPDSSEEILELKEVVHPAPSTHEGDELTDEPTKDAQIWAFIGACGGCGVSSLCVSTAYALASSGRSVLLVDLDFERGCLAAYLDIEPGLTLEELNQTDGRMDTDLASPFIKPYSENLSLLASTPMLGGNDHLNQSVLLALLDVVSTQYDFLILDVPSLWRRWTQAAICAADHLFLLAEARVPTLRQTAFLSSQIQSMSGPEFGEGSNTAPEIILNKYERRAHRGGLTLADTHQVLGFETSAQIVIDEDTLRAAINTGIPPCKLKPNARYSKSVQAFVDIYISLNTQALKRSA